MKWLSGDFVAEYNEVTDALKKEQYELDEKYSAKINRLIERETKRLDEVVPRDYVEGDQVINSFGITGTVVGSHIELSVRTSCLTENDNPVVGSNIYHALKNQSDEDIITLEGMLRLYTVRFPTTEFEKDWGQEFKTFIMYPDEITPLNE
tara:strand:+ start:92 stop:541 length:450 start_codon:yes stop_codon:yes gene_type:complete